MTSPRYGGLLLSFMALLLCLCLCQLPFAALAAASGERKIIAHGLGLTEDAARRQAYRNAVQSVIGTMVVAETIVENDEVVRDKVLSHSDGYISAARQIGGTRSVGDGLVEVTMEVTVKSDSLREKLQAVNITSTDFAGEALFKTALQEMEAREAGAAELKTLLADFPRKLVSARADTASAKSSFSRGGLVRYELPVKVGIDMAAYEAMAARLNQILVAQGCKRVQATVGLGKDGQLYTQGLLKKAGGAQRSAEGKPLHLVGVCELIVPEKNFSRWSLYLVPGHLLEAFRAPSTLGVQVELLDKALAPVAMQEVVLGGRGYANLVHPPAGIGSELEAFVAPRFNLFSRSLYLQADLNVSPQEKRITVNVTEEELDRITGARCTVSVQAGK